MRTKHTHKHDADVNEEPTTLARDDYTHARIHKPGDNKINRCTNTSKYSTLKRRSAHVNDASEKAVRVVEIATRLFASPSRPRRRCAKKKKKETIKGACSDDDDDDDYETMKVGHHFTFLPPSHPEVGEAVRARPVGSGHAPRQHARSLSMPFAR